MNNPLRHCLASALIGWALPTISWSAPAEINYQGRLTDGNGDAVTGNVSMSLKLFDAATGGNEIYSENIGTVTLDDNGVYNFQFGAGGQSVVDGRTTIALADGVTTSYSGSLASTPLSGTLAVADGTYNWNIVDGNPGQQATATAQLVNGFVIGITVSDGGEGYTTEPVVTINGNGTGATATAVVENGVLTAIDVDSTGSGYTSATVSIAAPPAPFVVDFVSGTVSVNYESAPAAGTEIVATYEVNESSIIGALSAANAHWLELSVDGTAQSPRERVLSVPFAHLALSAPNAGYANNATGDLRRELNRLQKDFISAINADDGINVSDEFKSFTDDVGEPLTYQQNIYIPYAGGVSDSLSRTQLSQTVHARHILAEAEGMAPWSRMRVNLIYSDGSKAEMTSKRMVNPHPEKSIKAVEGKRTQSGYASNLSFTFHKTEPITKTFPAGSVDRSLKTLWFYPKTSDLSETDPDQVSYYLVGSSGEAEINPGVRMAIPEGIGNIQSYRIEIVRDQNYVGDKNPLVGSFTVRYSE